jgi:hypothetical protein
VKLGGDFGAKLVPGLVMVRGVEHDEQELWVLVMVVES